MIDLLKKYEWGISIINFLKKIRSVFRQVLGYENVLWAKVVMNQVVENWLNELNLKELNVLEVSGEYWSKLETKKYTSVQYPAFDLCTDSLDEKFDLIITDQVFEHLLWPYRAGKNVYEMLPPDGYFLVTVPFLVQIHGAPVDCTRWSEIGLKYFLAECGFQIDKIRTGSWGNRKCIKSNYLKWRYFYRVFHSLKNEPEFPMVVWALAKK